MFVYSYLSIQYLRGLAALMVVVLHLHTGNIFAEAPAVSWLRGGVDIFFVISGFIMVKSTENKNYAPEHFYLKRIIRIVPIYWLATIVTIQTSGWTGWHGVASFLFLPVVHPEIGGYFPILPPGWTLNYEMFFYLVFGACLLFPAAYRFLATGLFLSMIVMAGFILSFGGVADFYTAPIMLEFVLGMIIAKSRRSISVLFVPIGLALMPILYSVTEERFLSLGLPAMLVVWGLVSVEHKMPKIQALCLVGDASYSIYLFHLLALGTIYNLWSNHWEMSALFIPAAIAFATVIGVLVHFAIERPITNYLNSRIGSVRRSPEQPAVSARGPIAR